MAKSNPHNEHRKRFKNRFLNESLENFQPHEILELLLYFSIPQGDTNELAHDLIEKFGSLSAVLDADYELLKNVNGVGDHTATMLRLMPQLSRAYLMDKLTRYPNFGDMHKLGSYLCNYFIGFTSERLVAVYLNNAFEMINFPLVVGEGSVNRTNNVLPRKIVESAFARNASFVVLAHNHPDGNSKPSDNDINTTKKLKMALDFLDIPLIEHFVIGTNSYTGIITNESSCTGILC